jgi:hypothetical protein
MRLLPPMGDDLHVKIFFRVGWFCCFYQQACAATIPAHVILQADSSEGDMAFALISLWFIHIQKIASGFELVGDT